MHSGTILASDKWLLTFVVLKQCVGWDSVWFGETLYLFPIYRARTVYFEHAHRTDRYCEEQFAELDKKSFSESGCFDLPRELQHTLETDIRVYKNMVYFYITKIRDKTVNARHQHQTHGEKAKPLSKGEQHGLFPHLPRCGQSS